MEFDSHVPRITANRLALTQALHAIMPDFSNILARWFSRNAAVIQGIADKHDLTRDQAHRHVLDYLQRHNGADSEVARDMDALLERVA